MEREERRGLAVLLVFLVVSGLFCAFTTGGGRGVSNIFSNLFSNIDYPPSWGDEATFDPLKQELGAYWLIGSITVVVGLVTLCCIGGYLLTRRRIPGSWCLFLMGLGAVAGLLILPASQMQTEIAAIPRPNQPVSSTYQGLVAGITLLKEFGALGGVLGLVGAGLFGWSWIRRRRSDSEPANP